MKKQCFSSPEWEPGCWLGGTLLASLLVVFVTPHASAQGTIQISFDGPPALVSGSVISVQSYSEAGFAFRPIGQTGPGNTFGRVATNSPAPLPNNGTAYVQTASGETFMFSQTNGGVFNLVSVDLAEYSTVFPDRMAVRFVGYYPNGASITRDVLIDGLIDGTGPLADFQTFTFSGWTGLSRVEIPTSGWSLDNLVVTIPEPSSGLLCLTGGLTLWLLRRRKPRQ